MTQFNHGPGIEQRKKTRVRFAQRFCSWLILAASLALILFLFFSNNNEEQSPSTQQSDVQTYSQSSSPHTYDWRTEHKEVINYLQNLDTIHYDLNRRGSLIYVVTIGENGKASKKLTGGHHRLYWNEDAPDHLMGKLGAMSEVVHLRCKIGTKPVFNRNSGADQMERQKKLAEQTVLRFAGQGFTIEQDGALKYLVDPSGKRMTTGYHRFWVDFSRQIIMGSFGATTEIAYVPKSWK